jgi:hypothetical protein
MLTVAPWLFRAYQLTGSVALSTQSGFFLWVGNNPYTFSRYPQESIDRSQAVAWAALSSQEKSEVETRRHNEALVDDWFRKKALDYIRDHPWRTIGNGLRKIVDAFGWVPSPRRSFWPSLAHALSYGPVMIFGLWGMWASGGHWREHSIFYGQFLAFAAVTAVYFGHTAYRAYLDVYWIVFAAGVLAALRSKHFRNRRASDNVAPFAQEKKFDVHNGDAHRGQSVTAGVRRRVSPNITDCGRPQELDGTHVSGCAWPGTTPQIHRVILRLVA